MRVFGLLVVSVVATAVVSVFGHLVLDIPFVPVTIHVVAAVSV